jgi:hypothetical protein
MPVMKYSRYDMITKEAEALVNWTWTIEDDTERAFWMNVGSYLIGLWSLECQWG